jgi:hypothetical protein
MPTYSFQTNAKLSRIAQEKVAVLTLDDPIFLHFPIESVDADTILYEQKDNYTGLQNVRGVGGQYSSVSFVGESRYIVIPGYFGDKTVIDEMKLLRLRQPGTFGTAIDASQLVLEGQELLLNREIDRQRFIAWAMTGGRFSAQSSQGAILYTDVFPIQGIDASGTQDGKTSGGQGGTGYSTVYSFVMTNWFNKSTATPTADLRQLAVIARGRGVTFGRKAVAYMNRNTWNAMIGNQNSADLKGTLISVLGAGVNIVGEDMFNEKIAVAADIPKIVVYDEVYLGDGANGTTPGVAYPFLADGEVRVMGARVDGNRLGAIKMTRNAENEGQAPGPYDAAIQSKEPPTTIAVYRGVNYGGIIEYPGSVVRCRVNGTSYGPLV